jgi:hypothetical protein
MRFVIEVPDELLRGGTGTGAAEAAPSPAQRAPLSGGAAADGALPGIGTLAETLSAGPAADGALPGIGTLAETLSAGPAEGGGVLASLEGGVMALDGGAAPE